MSEEELDVLEEWGVRAQKPLPLQRILLENGQNTLRPPASRKAKCCPASPKQSMYDKENIVLTKVCEKR